MVLGNYSRKRTKKVGYGWGAIITPYVAHSRCTFLRSTPAKTPKTVGLFQVQADWLPFWGKFATTTDFESVQYYLSTVPLVVANSQKLLV
jgi:hypothetical protein